MSKEEFKRPPKKFGDDESKALPNEDLCQTQEQPAEQLDVDELAVARRLEAMGTISNVGRGVLHEPTERQKENRKCICRILLDTCERKPL